MYADGLSPLTGPAQSFKYPAQPRHSNTFSFITSSHTSLYLTGCLLAADGVFLPVSTSSLSSSSVIFLFS